MCVELGVDRILGLDSFEELLIPLHAALEEMKLNNERVFNKNTTSRALQLFAAIDFEFVVNLVITRSLFDMSL